MQKSKLKTKLKDQNQNLETFLNFDLGSNLCNLHFALFITHYELLTFEFK
jgi:hypothetical protein